ncbi:hypothetical protein [Nonomuraea soli]|uniref:Preprotein translocase subunit SecY n=1 Tax=Nonomuraea soli TaxID=1032476 RepID=A0A7W0CIJ0_9ACTN|nr:hypothetical protein [Nonomuraea soli]MBA2891867.1 preprotein translocase subunit SecY [Nonomuraea soli]
MSRFVNAVVALGAFFFLAGGAWAFFWPHSFYSTVATFPPFNLHLFHDAGAFQLGIGAALTAALFTRDALIVGLAGGAAGAVVHAISHVVDRNLGGNPSDPWTLSGLALLLVVATILRYRQQRNSSRKA